MCCPFAEMGGAEEEFAGPAAQPASSPQATAFAPFAGGLE